MRSIGNEYYARLFDAGNFQNESPSAHSLLSTTTLENMPWVTALRLLRSLPCGVRGPVAFGSRVMEVEEMAVGAGVDGWVGARLETDCEGWGVSVFVGVGMFSPEVQAAFAYEGFQVERSRLILKGVWSDGNWTDVQKRIPVRVS